MIFRWMPRRCVGTVRIGGLVLGFSRLLAATPDAFGRTLGIHFRPGLSTGFVLSLMCLSTCLVGKHSVGRACALMVAFDREFSDFIGLEESEVHQLIAAKGLSPSSGPLFQAMETLDRKPFRDWHRIQATAKPYDSKSWNEWLPQTTSLREGVFTVQGYLESVRIHVSNQGAIENLGLEAVAGTSDAASKNGGGQASEGIQPIDGFTSPTITVYECVITLKGVGVGRLPEQAKVQGESRRLRLFTPRIPKLFLGLGFEVGADGVRSWVKPKTDVSAIDGSESAVLESDLRVFATVVAIGNKGMSQFADFETQVPLDPLPTGITKRLGWAGGDVALMESLVKGSDSMVAKEGSHSPEQVGHIVKSWQSLSAAGFDLGLLDSMAISQRRSLIASDNEGFYQMLAAVGKSSPGLQFDSEIPIRESILNPNKMVGQGFRVYGVVKQITRVQNEMGERGDQLGMSHYYLLHMLVPLKKPIRLNFSKDKQITYQQHFPVVVACVGLPPGLQAGESMRQWVHCDAYFFKLWSYQSSRTVDSSLDQWSPLMVGYQPGLESPPEGPRASWPIGWLLLIPVTLATFGLLAAGISGYRRKPRFQSKKR